MRCLVINLTSWSNQLQLHNKNFLVLIWKHHNLVLFTGSVCIWSENQTRPPTDRHCRYVTYCIRFCAANNKSPTAKWADSLAEGIWRYETNLHTLAFMYILLYTLLIISKPSLPLCTSVVATVVFVIREMLLLVHRDGYQNNLS